MDVIKRGFTCEDMLLAGEFSSWKSEVRFGWFCLLTSERRDRRRPLLAVWVMSARLLILRHEIAGPEESVSQANGHTREGEGGRYRGDVRKNWRGQIQSHSEQLEDGKIVPGLEPCSVRGKQWQKCVNTVDLLLCGWRHRHYPSKADHITGTPRTQSEICG